MVDSAISDVSQIEPLWFSQAGYRIALCMADMDRPGLEYIHTRLKQLLKATMHRADTSRTYQQLNGLLRTVEGSLQVVAERNVRVEPGSAAASVLALVCVAGPQDASTIIERSEHDEHDIRHAIAHLIEAEALIGASQGLSRDPFWIATEVGRSALARMNEQA